MTTTTRNEAAERLRSYVHGLGRIADPGVDLDYADLKIDKALAEAEKRGAREAVERIRARLAAEVDPQPQGGRILAILDEEAAR